MREGGLTAERIECRRGGVEKKEMEQGVDFQKEVEFERG